MATAMRSVSPPQKTFAGVPAGIGVPLGALVWVFLNVTFMALGIRYSAHSPLFSMAVGGLDGGIFGWILITAFSEKLHAGTAGLLGGYGFQDMLNRFKLTGKYAAWIHSQMDPLLDAVLGPNREALHTAIMDEIVWIASAAAVVALATLIIQMIRSASVKPAVDH